MNWNLVSVFAFLLLVMCVFCLLLTASLFGRGPVSITIQAAAVILMIWARATFGMRSFHASANPTRGGLVITGPYRYLRHPIYAAILYFVWAGIVAHFSIRNVLIGVVASAGLALRIRAEEILVQRAYPEYAQYARGTARVLPFLL